MSNPGRFLNQENIIRKVFEQTTDSLRVTFGGGAPSVAIDAADDSIAIGDRNTGTLASVAANTGLNINILGITPVGGKLPVEVGSLNVTVDNAQLEISNDIGNPIPISDAGGSITVDANNLDIRDLTFASDKVDVSNSVVALDAPTLAALENITATVANDINLSASTLAALENVSINNFPANQDVTITNPSLAVTGNWLTDAQLRASDVNVNVTNFPATQTVVATDLDIRDLTFASDKVDVSNSVIALDSATLAALENITVTVDNFPTNQTISGTVALDSATLAALETINVGNFPALQDVNITNASIAVTGIVDAVQSGIWNINNVSGTISLPTGAATEVTLQTIATDVNALAFNQLSGSQKSIVRGGAKGSTLQGDVTSTDLGVNRQALDVAVLQDLPLTFATDKVDVSGSVVALDSASLAALENITVTVSSEVEISNDSGNPVPISALNLPLPTGAATEVTLSALLTELQLKADLTETQPVSVAGVSTAANQVTANASLASIDSKLTAPLTVQATDLDTRDLTFATDKVDVSNSVVALDSATLAALENTTVTVSNFPATQTVQATNLDIRDLVFATDKVDVTGSTVSLDAAALAALENITVNVSNEVEVSNDAGNPIPVNGTVSALQSGTWSVRTQDGAGNLLASSTATPLGTEQGLIVRNIPSGTQTISGTVTANAGAGTFAISAASLPLPTGAATSANQDIANASLASIDSKLTSPLTVQATNLDIRDLVFATDKVDVSNSIVALDSATLAALENTTVTVSNFPSVQPINDNGGSITVDGSVAITGSVAVTGPLTDSELRASPVPVSGTVTANLGTIAGVATETTLSALNTKIPANLTVTSTRLLVDGSGVTQPISAASLPLPTGAATAANQATANASLSSIDAKLTAPLTTVVNDVDLTPSSPSGATVSNSLSSTIVAANPSRTGLVITNLSNNRVFLAFGANPAVANNGIALLPGGTWTMDKNTFTTQAVNARANTGGANAVSIQEFV